MNADDALIRTYFNLKHCIFQSPSSAKPNEAQNETRLQPAPERSSEEGLFSSPVFVKILKQKLCYNCPRGVMDNISVFGTEDSRFESWRGHRNKCKIRNP